VQRISNDILLTPSGAEPDKNGAAILAIERLPEARDGLLILASRERPPQNFGQTCCRKCGNAAAVSRDGYLYPPSVAEFDSDGLCRDDIVLTCDSPFMSTFWLWHRINLPK